MIPIASHSTLTVLIPCKNEQAHIQACIQSARPIADEILIADSGSTDRTLDIVRQLGGCRVIEREFVNSGNFKNWAIPQAKHPWVLIVDADERVTSELATEITQLLQSHPQKDGYWVYRQNYFFGHRIRHSGWGQDKVIRLIRRDVARYREYTDHTEIDLPAHRLGTLRQRLEHYTCHDYSHYIQKLLRYTELQAELWYRQGRRPSMARLVLNGPLRFLRSYVVNRGFLDGVPGLIVCGLTGFYSFLKQARLWQKYYGRKASTAQSRALRDAA